MAAALLLLAGCDQAARNAFVEPTSSPGATALPKPQLPTAALAALRARLMAGLLPHLAGGHLDAAWGPGAAPAPAGPYVASGATLDAVGLLALRSMASGAHASGVPSGGPDATLLASILAEAPGPGAEPVAGDGALLMLLDRLQDHAGLPANPCPAGTDHPSTLDCARRLLGDALARTWYAGDSHTFAHVGDATTTYRPVDAFGLGAALAAAGYAGHDYDRIDAALAVAASETAHDFDPLTGMGFGHVRAAAGGAREGVDPSSRPADQAGIAELLMEAFDVSREGAFKAEAATVLDALLNERVPLRHNGYAQAVDLQLDHATSVSDVQATVLVLEAAHHYDIDDGGRFGALEVTAARELLAAACTPAADACDSGTGPAALPAALDGAAPQARSGLVTALAVIVLGEASTNSL